VIEGQVDLDVANGIADVEFNAAGATHAAACNDDPGQGRVAIHQFHIVRPEEQALRTGQTRGGEPDRSSRQQHLVSLHAYGQFRGCPDKAEDERRYGRIVDAVGRAHLFDTPVASRAELAHPCSHVAGTSRHIREDKACQQRFGTAISAWRS
jgi:hypothetical protein